MTADYDRCSYCGTPHSEHPPVDFCDPADAEGYQDPEPDYAPLRAKVAKAKDQLDLALRCLNGSRERGDRWHAEAMGELRRLEDTLAAVSRSVSYL